MEFDEKINPSPFYDKLMQEKRDEYVDHLMKLAKSKFVLDDEDFPGYWEKSDTPATPSQMESNLERLVKWLHLDDDDSDSRQYLGFIGLTKEDAIKLLFRNLE